MWRALTADTRLCAAEAGKGAAAEGGASWWMDTFRPTLLQALLNMTVVLRNVALHCQAGGVTADLSCGMLHAATAADAELATRPVTCCTVIIRDSSKLSPGRHVLAGVHSIGFSHASARSSTSTCPSSKAHITLQDDEGWLTKALELRNLRLDVQQKQPDGKPPLHNAPLLHTPRLQVRLHTVAHVSALVHITCSRHMYHV